MMNKWMISILIGMAALIVGDCLGEPPVVISFGAEPDEICNGESINLSWEVAGADNVSIEPRLFEVDAAGSQIVFPRNNTTYRLTAINPDGNATVDLNVTVEDCIAIGKFQASPEKICKGENATLRWMVFGAENVTIDNGIGEVNSTGSIEVSADENTTYTLTAVNGTRNVKTPLTLAVDLSCPSIESFESDRPEIILGSNATLSWNVTNADHVSINNGVGEFGLEGSVQVSPNSNITYTLNATNGSNSVVMERIINVSVKFPEIIDFTATPGSIVRGTTATLSWNVTGADRVSIDHDIGMVDNSGKREVIGEESTNYILTAGNASGNVTEMAEISVDDTAYDFVARAEYANWYAVIDNQETPLPDFPISDTSPIGYAKWGDDAESILRIGSRDGGKIIGDYTEDMRTMGYFIDPRDMLSIQAEVGYHPMTDLIIQPMLGKVALTTPYNLKFSMQSVEDETSLMDYAGDEPKVLLVVDCNGMDYGDDVNINELKIIRE